MSKPFKAHSFANCLQSQFANENILLQNTNLQFTKIYFTFAFSKLQNQTLKMDISSRLKEFLDYTGMQSTQFADSCGIPRPSFSQLLRGRNKKVSDEVITKIHESFPQLSILWLMFGEGNMVTSSNIEISEPENAGSPLLHANQHLDNEPNNPETGNPCNHRELSQSTNIPPLPGINVPDSVPDNTPFAISSSSAVKNNTSPSCNTASALNNVQHDSMPIIGINSNDAGQRRVVSIMVFYNDNSFETFVPEKTK
ncbi:helix-turn-helix domain-containing protein [Muribaculum intestinale]|uniref:helix-turn-helix domain-containing protein n=1 Tax=Muribaculum intestinale TaxID=1796646 RepID=UPI00241C636F|nr:helix-turn-helix transcriptional regulator [Muribaculum intestinale]